MGKHLYLQEPLRSWTHEISDLKKQHLWLCFKWSSGKSSRWRTLASARCFLGSFCYCFFVVFFCGDHLLVLPHVFKLLPLWAVTLGSVFSGKACSAVSSGIFRNLRVRGNWPFVFTPYFNYTVTDFLFADLELLILHSYKIQPPRFIWKR